MSYISIYIHCVWGTKHREPIFFTYEERRELFQHIYETAHQKGIYIDTIGGWQEHVHCLIELRPTQTLSDVIHQLKGESSYWYNVEKKGKLAWQDEYFAASVSQSRLEIVRKYIRNQESHHRHNTFATEYALFSGHLSRKNIPNPQ